jgi:hypothetical protein
MGRNTTPVSDADVKKSLAIMKKYLNENGLNKKPFHFKHYLIRNCQIGDYVMRVVFQHSQRIYTNKLYPVVSCYSNRWGMNRSYLVVISEKGEEYEIDTTNFGQHWVYFEKKEVEKKIKLSVPDDIVEYNVKLANEITRKLKRKQDEKLRYW